MGIGGAHTALRGATASGKCSYSRCSHSIARSHSFRQVFILAVLTQHCTEPQLQASVPIGGAHTALHGATASGKSSYWRCSHSIARSHSFRQVFILAVFTQYCMEPQLQAGVHIGGIHTAL